MDTLDSDVPNCALMQWSVPIISGDLVTEAFGVHMIDMGTKN